VGGVIIGRGALRNPWIFTDQTEAPVLMALVAFIALQELGLSSGDKLVQLAEKTAGRQLSHEGEFWGIVRSVAELLGQNPQTPADLVVSSRALSRGKMLWNYLRSSLPDPFMAPAVMRSSTLSDFILGIEGIARQNEMTSASLDLRYRRELDWMYSGAGRSNKVPDLIVAKL
jgi:tRNA-dihydrouridine synthase